MAHVGSVLDEINLPAVKKRGVGRICQICNIDVNSHLKILLCSCLLELMLYVPVNSNGHVRLLPPFYLTFTQHICNKI